MPDCLKELSHEEITKKIDDAYDSDENLGLTNDEDDGEE